MAQLRKLPPRQFATRMGKSGRYFVWADPDSCRCAFVGTHSRCTETAFLEFHHIKPFACSGKSTVDNIELRCRAHNQREAELFFGVTMPGVVRETADAFGQLGPDLVLPGASLSEFSR